MVAQDIIRCKILNICIKGNKEIEKNKENPFSRHLTVQVPLHHAGRTAEGWTRAEMGIDYHLHAYVKPSSYSADMDYPSTTQALFALIVMVVVLLFILVYCCSGAFPCNRTEEGTAYAEHIRTTVFGPNRNRNNSNDDVAGQTTVVIVPVNGMLYYTDEQGHQRQLGGAVPRIKPPAYSCIFAPPPPYSARAATPSPTDDCVQPPPYEESFRDWKLTVDNENMFESCLKDSSGDPQNANPISQYSTVQDKMQLLSKERGQSSSDITNANTQIKTVFGPHSPVPLETHTIISPVYAVPSASSEVQNAPYDSTSDLQTLPGTSDNNIVYNSPSCDDSSLPSIRSRSSEEGSVPPPSNAPRSEGLPPPPSNASSSGGLVSPPVNHRLSTSDRQLALRVPDSDVYSLLRDVTIAEDSRRGSDGDVRRDNTE